MQTTTEYLTTFFEEKNIPDQTFRIEHEGVVHLISSQYVIDTIIAVCDDSEQNQVADVLRNLDFHNSEILPFLRHLALGLVASGFTMLEEP